MNSSRNITNMPPELLGEIFAYTSLLDPNAPLVLVAVSRTFHRVVRNTPHAWTILKLRMDTLDGADARCIRKAELWFAMAGVCSVDLEVRMEMDELQEYARSQSMRAIATAPSVPAKDTLSMPDSTIPLLPHVLRTYANRIWALSFYSTTVDEAQIFLSVLYPTSPSIPSHESSPMSPLHSSIDYPLRKLTLHASSDGSRPLAAPYIHNHPRSRGPLMPMHHYPAPHAHHAHASPTHTPTTVALPRLPNLTHLKLINHPLPYGFLEVKENVRRLRELSVVHPLRFAPISVCRLVGVLSAARGLERLEVEARLMDSRPSSGATFGSSAPGTPPLTSTLPFGSSSLSTPPPSSSSSSSTYSHHGDLTLLPFLTHLSLRTNNLPSLLSHLLLPALHTLRIDDLDGKRAGGAGQSGAMLRQVLVRMELPCEWDAEQEDGALETRGGRRGAEGRGLEVLEMCGVGVCGSSFSSSSSASLCCGSTCSPSARPSNGIGAADAAGGEGGANGEDEDNEVWGWCFRRMTTLRELKITKMDTGVVLGLITPSMATSRSATATATFTAEAQVDDAVLPRLEKLTIVDSCPSCSSTSSSSLSSPCSFSPAASYPLMPVSMAVPTTPAAGPLLKFQMRRPEVRVGYDVVVDPLYQLQLQSLKSPSLSLRGASPVAVDYFGLYSG